MIVIMLRELLQYFQKLLDFCQTKLVTKVITDHGYEYKPLMPVSELGHLIPMKCGHRGKPNRHEERMLENLIRESGFLDV